MSKARLVITAVIVEGRSEAEVAAIYGVSKGWVSKLVARYRLEGEAAFEPRSRRPGKSPLKLTEMVDTAGLQPYGDRMSAQQQLVDRHVRHRLAVLLHAEEVSGNVAMTCRYYGVSRPTFYQWLHRYREQGAEIAQFAPDSRTALATFDIYRISRDPVVHVYARSCRSLHVRPPAVYLVQCLADTACWRPSH